MRPTVLSLAVALLAVAQLAAAEKYCLRQSGDSVTVETRACTPLETDYVEAEYNTTYTTTGWDNLVVSPLQAGAALSVPQSWYYAGYIEGFLTYDRIWQQYNNVVVPSIPPWANVTDWVEEHRTYIGSQVQNLGGSDTFWGKIGHILQQIKGMQAGYSAAQNDNSRSLNETQFFWGNFMWEFPDILVLMAPPELSGTLKQATRRGSHCSALVRDTGSDLFMAHDTWSSFTTMLRQYKVYNFEPTVAFSGYPGAIVSGDDWYMTSNRLTTQETTNVVFNVSLTRNYVKTSSVSEFLRVMTANYLAADGQTWTKLVNTENSGTYCNQWMVVDMKLYNPNGTSAAERTPANTLWVYEQIPGPWSMAADVTPVLVSQGYWASYNMWYFPQLFALSGQLAQEQMWGPMLGYKTYARAEIFARNATSVTNLWDMQQIMRYNNFRHDPLSRIPSGCYNEPNHTCSPPYSAMLTIASRGDLEPVDNSGMGNLTQTGWIGTYGAFGATDSKITSYSMTLDPTNLRGSIISGPTTYGGLVPFSWSTNLTLAKINPHDGQVDTFNFAFIDVTAGPTKIRHPENTGQSAAIAVVVVLSVVLVLVFVGLAYRNHAKLASNGENQPLTIGS